MNTFPLARRLIADFSFALIAEYAAGMRYERGWDRKLDLAPADFEAWHGSRLAQAREIAECYRLAFVNLFEEFVARCCCDVRGHLFEDIGSYANAEGGADHLQCKRCGFNFDHIYY